jgi:succinate dehydrogenase/fumarate reductase flavoprotein subunit
MTYDVAVVGAGLGGVSAAVRAAELGATVLLVEAGEELGGTAVFSGGGIHIWGAQSWDEYRRHCPLADPRLARTLFDNFQPYVDWLVASGAPGAYGASTLRGLTLTKYQIGGSIAPAGKRRWFRYLGDRLMALGGTVLTGSRVTGLRLEEAGLFSLTVTRRGAPAEVRAKKVILAAGGFQASPELLAQHAGLSVQAFVVRSVPHDQGDGLRLAKSVGAATTDSMDTLYGHLMPVPPCQIGWSNYLDPMLLSAYYAEQAVVLNVRGERFVDEGVGELNGETINASARQPPGGLWIVFDEVIRRTHVRYQVPSNLLRPASLRHGWLLRYLGLSRQGGQAAVFIDSLRLARDRGATILQARSFEELGRRLQAAGADGDRAVETIREFNTRVDHGTAAQLAVPRTQAANPIRSAPFYAVKVGVGVSMTYGGVAIDERTRVLDGSGAPIPGLYAVPGTAGGVHHLHYAGALAACGVFGMIAGTDAAGQRATDRGLERGFKARSRAGPTPQAPGTTSV